MICDGKVYMYWEVGMAYTQLHFPSESTITACKMDSLINYVVLTFQKEKVRSIKGLDSFGRISDYPNLSWLPAKQTIFQYFAEALTDLKYNEKPLGNMKKVTCGDVLTQLGLKHNLAAARILGLSGRGEKIITQDVIAYLEEIHFVFPNQLS